MNAIIGMLVTVAMVFGGYLLAGGKMEIITHALPFEGMMIGGAALGAFLAANDLTTIKHTVGDIVSVFKGPKWKKQDYKDLLSLLFQLTKTMKLEEAANEISQQSQTPNSFINARWFHSMVFGAIVVSVMQLGATLMIHHAHIVRYTSVYAGGALLDE